MKIASAKVDGNPLVVVAKDNDWLCVPCSGVFSALRSVRAVIENWNSIEVDELWDNSTTLSSEPKFLCPLPTARKVICVGKNYADHAQEMGGEAPSTPVIFNKFASCLIADGESIEIPAICQRVDYEAELVAVIGKPGRNIARESALEHVFGYTIGNDVTSRDWQKGKPGGQWLLGKAIDTFGPLGPHIVTADSIDDPQNLDIALQLNGETMQSANTSQMIFSIDFLVAYISQFFTLSPGDLIFTGTPAGVGAGRSPEVYLTDGDSVSVTIEKIGTLTNPVVSSVR